MLKCGSDGGGGGVTGGNDGCCGNGAGGCSVAIIEADMKSERER